MAVDSLKVRWFWHDSAHTHQLRRDEPNDAFSHPHRFFVSRIEILSAIERHVDNVNAPVPWFVEFKPTLLHLLYGELDNPPVLAQFLTRFLWR